MCITDTSDRTLPPERPVASSEVDILSSLMPQPSFAIVNSTDFSLSRTRDVSLLQYSALFSTVEEVCGGSEEGGGILHGTEVLTQHIDQPGSGPPVSFRVHARKEEGSGTPARKGI